MRALLLLIIGLAIALGGPHGRVAAAPLAAAALTADAGHAGHAGHLGRAPSDQGRHGGAFPDCCTVTACMAFGLPPESPVLAEAVAFAGGPEAYPAAASLAIRPPLKPPRS